MKKPVGWARCLVVVMLRSCFWWGGHYSIAPPDWQGVAQRVTHSPYFQPTMGIISVLINIDQIGKQWFDLLTIGVLWWVVYYIVFEMLFIFMRVHILLILYTTLYYSLWLRYLLWHSEGSLQTHSFALFH